MSEVEHPAGQPSEPRPEHDGDATLTAAWAHVLNNAPEGGTRTWLMQASPLTVHEQTVVVAVSSNFARERLETRLRSHVEDSLSDFFNRTMHLAVTVDSDLSLPALGMVSTAGAEQEPLPAEPTEPPRPVRPHSAARTQERASDRLNPKYTFETFVIGSSNRFAHAAAVAVAEAPGKAYNPLMIYGDSGLGKTHLLHALGHYVKNYYERVRVRYVSTEEMTNDFINAIQDNRTAEFRSRYRDVDVLLIDDIQFLESKIQTQEEFFHTFNTLHNAQKQIVMTSDRPPKALTQLEARLRSRFEWGLITDIQPPDLETRIAILRKKAAAERLAVSPEVLEFIASKIQTNIRELEGALIRVTAFASLSKQQPSMALAETVLKDLLPEGRETQIDAALIISQTAAFFGLTVEDLTGSSRSQVVALARQIAMYLCRELTDLSLPKIGQQFGGKDHTTVMYANKKVKELMSSRMSIYNQVTELTNRIKQDG